MTDNINKVQTDEQEQIPPIIPPWIMLAASGISFLVALSVLLISPTFGVVGWGALVVGVLLLVLLVVLAPQAAVDFLTGRSARFGGVSLVVTLLLLAVLITLYWFIDSQNWTYDITQTDQYTLNEEGQEVMARFGSDPTVADVEIVAFFDSGQIGLQEQTEVLLEDYVAASNGKVTYRFENPDRNPRLAGLYGATPGTLVILNTERPEPEAAESVSAFGLDQNQLTNSIIAATTTGEFNVYFLEVDDGVSISDGSEVGATRFVALGQDALAWNFEEASISELTAEDTEINLGDPNVDGEVLVIAGGSAELGPAEIDFLTEYLDGGGSLIISAVENLEDNALASSPLLNDYLSENFGISFAGEVILDPRNSRGGLANVIDVQNLTRQTIITQNIPQGFSLVLRSARAIDVAEETPTNIEVFTLAQTSANAYSKSFDELVNEDIEQNDEDPAGPFPVLVAAENTETGAKVVLIGGSEVFMNIFETGQQLANWDIGYGALFWATEFVDYIQGQEPLLPNFDVRPADTPVFADTAQLNLINFISLFALPFGVLAIGGVVWFFRRRA
jgi:ABC-2 type transport system permease protein